MERGVVSFFIILKLLNINFGSFICKSISIIFIKNLIKGGLNICFIVFMFKIFWFFFLLFLIIL